MRIGILFSSGKDSTATLWYYLEQGWDVCCLLSLLPKNPDSWMFQNPSKELLEKQAESLGFPLLVQRTEGEKEKELVDLKELLKEAKIRYDIDAIGVGALASDYQHERVNRMAHELGLKTFAPLWHKNQVKLLRQMIEADFDIRMTRVAADGLTEGWLGKKLQSIDLKALEKLHEHTGFHVAGEGGEYETIVLDGPIFKNAIKIEFETEMESAHRGELKIKEIQ
ncbi:diphthine--ammonia ligase [Candidatus Woesearchaeota archaeon]|nr:diphthine--ammonia ligase [Candidatus Woesearchaeota archaeon]